MFGHFMRLEEALKAGFEPRSIHSDYKVGDTVEMEKITPPTGWHLFKKEVVWVTLHSQPEIDRWQELIKPHLVQA